MSGSNCRTSAQTKALLLAVVSAHCSLANSTTPADIEETVVVASRVATPMNTLGVSVTIIDEEELLLLGYNNLAAVLDLQPGVAVTQDGGLGKASTVRIRGEEGFRTRVLLDGIDVADPSSPQISPRLEHLLTPGLQRLEILRGPQGLMYGADGGGVVAITTLAPTAGVNVDLATETGSYGFQRWNGHITGGTSDFSGALSVADVKTDGYNIRSLDDRTRDADGYSNTTLHGTVNAHLNERISLGATLHSLDGDNEYDGCFDATTFLPINDCRDDFQQEAWRSWARYSSELFSSELSYEQSSIERGFYSAGIESYRTEGDQRELTWLTNVTLNNEQRLTLGTDLQEQSLSDAGGTRKRDNTGAYLEYQRPLLLGSATAGLRYDDNDDFGQHISWRISAVQELARPQASSPLALKMAVGTGFRAPSLYEVAYNSGPWALPPAAGSSLQEEQSFGWEAGLHWGSTDRFIAATWFDQNIENEIYFDLSSYAGYLQRAGKAISKGLEVSAATPLWSHFSMSANLTWNDAEDHTGNPRPYRPELTAAATLRYTGPVLSSALTARLVQDSYDNLGDPMDDYHLVDWSIAAELGNGLVISGRIENLSDENYEQVRGYSVAGRSWFAGIRYHL